MDDAALANIFSYHAPKDDKSAHPGVQAQTFRYESLRNGALVLAKLINLWCPESREKALAITNLQQAVMWANASIAINET